MPALLLEGASEYVVVELMMGAGGALLLQNMVAIVMVKRSDNTHKEPVASGVERPLEQQLGYEVVVVAKEMLLLSVLIVACHKG